MGKGLTRTLASSIFLMLLSTASYATPAITLTGYTDYSDGQWSLGFEFSPTENIDVTALGSFFPTGATDEHGVSLWTAAGALLDTTTVTGTGTEGFDYTAIAPLLLTAGTDYIVSATTLADLYADNGATWTVASGINYIEHVETACAVATPVCFPTTGYTSFGDFGANFQFTAAPEPPAIMVLGTGLLIFGLWGWRKRKSSIG